MPHEPERAITSAVVVALPASAEGPLRPLFDLLAAAGLTVAMVESAEDAAGRLLLAERDQPTAVLVDVGDVSTGAAPLAEVEARLRTLRELVPWAAPILVARAPSLAAVVEGMRAGAADALDLATEGSVELARVLARAARAHAERQSQRRTVSALRKMIEDFLRDLVKTERRSIDLEHRLRRQERPAGPLDVVAELDEDRPATVFVVEDDREVADRLVEEMEEAGLVTFAFLSGEEAVAQGERMAGRGEAIDLALCDLRLPGIDGLETVRRLRAHKAGLAAFLMTGYTDVDAATSAADLGVVGFVLKPFDDLHALVERIKDQAQQAMARTREHHYLQRIKERHDHVLQRYRKLAAEIDR